MLHLINLLLDSGELFLVGSIFDINGLNSNIVYLRVFLNGSQNFTFDMYMNFELLPLNCFNGTS